VYTDLKSDDADEDSDDKNDKKKPKKNKREKDLEARWWEEKQVI
jgi:hypothetical protein